MYSCGAKGGICIEAEPLVLGLARTGPKQLRKHWKQDLANFLHLVWFSVNRLLLLWLFFDEIATAVGADERGGVISR